MVLGFGCRPLYFALVASCLVFGLSPRAVSTFVVLRSWLIMQRTFMNTWIGIFEVWDFLSSSVVCFSVDHQWPGVALFLQNAFIFFGFGLSLGFTFIWQSCFSLTLNLLHLELLRIETITDLFGWCSAWHYFVGNEVFRETYPAFSSLIYKFGRTEDLWS